MKTRKIDLREKSLRQANAIVKRLIKFKKEKKLSISFIFLLPSYKMRKRNINKKTKLRERCPYCSSVLVEIESGIVCSGINLRKIVRDIELAQKRWGNKIELFLDKKAYQFYDYYLLMGKDLICDYIKGTEEQKFRINNRILRPGVKKNLIRK